LEPWNIRKLLTWAAPYLEAHRQKAPRLSAELMLSKVLNLSRLQLYLDYDRPLSAGELAAFKTLLLRRKASEPVAYITGNKEFFGLSLQVGPGVLIPRPESEHVVEAALDFAREHRLSAPVILDLCTGSGAIALALAANLADAKVWATDLSPQALRYARDNARSLNLADKVNFLQGDLWQPLPAMTFDIITANPPYVSASEWEDLEREVRDYEPRAALWGGADGLDIIRAILAGAGAYLRCGLLVIELGAGQAAAARRAAEQTGFARISLRQDLAGHQRVLLCEGCVK
jgi:release factor glutamine methyltransferase